MNRVLIITGDPIGFKLAGPAIRAWNMAEQLSQNHEVVLLSLSSAERTHPEFEIAHVTPGDEIGIKKYEEWCNVVVFQGHALLVFETLQRSTKVMVVDIYDPMHLEQLEQARLLTHDKWEEQVRDATLVLNDQLRRGDFFLCASERQRLFWLGQLAGLGRINPMNYESDPDLTGLIAVAPFGLSRTPPVQSRKALKGVHPGIAESDLLILWSGGLYNWFDPHTLIQAVAILSSRHTNIRLFFQGTKHPHPGVPEMEIVKSSRELASDLGVLNSSVFFNDSWVDFDDRQNYLLEADVGTSTHHSHIETTFSFRTRILDYLWAELPMVVTEGDHFGDLVKTNNLGISVKAGDPVVLAEALEAALYNRALRKEYKKNIRHIREQYYWDVALAPLVEFINQLRYSADHSHIPLTGLSAAELPYLHRRRNRLKEIATVSIKTLRNEGPRTFFQKITRKLNS